MVMSKKVGRNCYQWCYCLPVQLMGTLARYSIPMKIDEILLFNPLIKKPISHVTNFPYIDQPSLKSDSFQISPDPNTSQTSTIYPQYNNTSPIIQHVSPFSKQLWHSHNNDYSNSTPRIQHASTEWALTV